MQWNYYLVVTQQKPYYFQQHVECIILHEISQQEKDKYHILLLICRN